MREKRRNKSFSEKYLKGKDLRLVKADDSGKCHATDCWKGGYWKGSYTIEAAAVISLVMFVLGALLICSFYLHDKSVLQGAVCEIAVAGSNFAKKKEQKEAITSAKKRISASRFMGSRNLNGGASTGKKESTASWSAIFPVPGFAMKYLANNQLTITKEWTSKILDPAETIRKVRGAEKLFSIESG